MDMTKRYDLIADITSICLNNGGVTKPMADKLADYVQAEIEGAFLHGSKVGEYRTANRLYSDITTLYMFKNNLDNPKVGTDKLIGDLLKDVEKVLNDNSAEYREYLRELRTIRKNNEIT